MTTDNTERKELEPPDRIFAFKRPDGGNSWHAERLEASDVEYIRAVVAAPRRCKWCEQGDLPMFLDRDGTRCDITHQPGVLSHAHEEYWWPCLRFGFELHWPVSSPVAPSLIPEQEHHEFLQYPLGRFRDLKDDIGKCWCVVNMLYCGLPRDAEIHQIATTPPTATAAELR